MTWLVKNDHDEYLTESTRGEAWWHEKRKFAKRFTDQGLAYRVAMRWDGKVVRLVPQQPRPAKPPTKFQVGDVVVPSDDLLAPHGTVENVEQHWIGGEWREYIGGQMHGGHFGGNADLYVRVPQSSPATKDGNG